MVAHVQMPAAAAAAATTAAAAVPGAVVAVAVASWQVAFIHKVFKLAMVR
jgi:hypothetical protein